MLSNIYCIFLYAGQKITLDKAINRSLMKGLEVMTLSKRLKKMTSQKESNEDNLKNTSSFFIATN